MQEVEANKLFNCELIGLVCSSFIEQNAFQREIAGRMKGGIKIDASTDFCTENVRLGSYFPLVVDDCILSLYTAAASQ